MNNTLHLLNDLINSAHAHPADICNYPHWSEFDRLWIGFTKKCCNGFIVVYCHLLFNFWN